MDRSSGKNYVAGACLPFAQKVPKVEVHPRLLREVPLTLFHNLGVRESVSVVFRGPKKGLLPKKELQRGIQLALQSVQKLYQSEFLVSRCVLPHGPRLKDTSQEKTD